MAESLSARNIVKRYGGVVALSDGNLEVRAREVVALIGGNGSGKSTMSKVINGVVVLDGGNYSSMASLSISHPHRPQRRQGFPLSFRS